MAIALGRYRLELPSLSLLSVSISHAHESSGLTEESVAQRLDGLHESQLLQRLQVEALYLSLTHLSDIV